jgi:hypothetical protein
MSNDNEQTHPKNRPAVGGPVERIVRRAAEAWRAWRRRREWAPERQLEHLRQMVMGDHRWLAHDKTADALTTRYLAALAPDWMSRVHAHPDHVRRDLGLEPTYALKLSEPGEVLARAQRIERGEPLYADGPLPERGWD